MPKSERMQNKHIYNELKQKTKQKKSNNYGYYYYSKNWGNIVFGFHHNHAQNEKIKSYIKFCIQILLYRYALRER